MTFWRLVWPLISGLLMSLFTMPAGYNQWQTGMDTERPPNATENIQRLVIIYILIIFLNITTYASPCSFILGQTVAEKENKMKETLAIMSLGRVSYMLANVATEFCYAAFSSLVFFYGYMGPMWIIPVYENSVLF